MNIKDIPFSRFGSYMAISYFEEKYKTYKNEAGIYLRNIRGSVDDVPVCRFTVLHDGNKVEYTYVSSPYELVLTSEAGTIQICYADEKTIVIRGKGDRLSLVLEEITLGVDSCNYIHEIPYNEKLHYVMNCYKNCSKYLLYNQEGNLTIKQNWEVEYTTACKAEFSTKEGVFLAIIEEVPSEWNRKDYSYNYDFLMDNIVKEIDIFRNKMPSVPEAYAQTKEIAAYVNWASVVAKSGFLTRDTMYMSKNWMTSVWSWDHCFNAIALSYGHPQLAWDQFMILFDYQEASGLIPDFLNEAFIFRNCCKPPVHGWALGKMMQNMSLSKEQLQEAYTKIGKWTQWWFDYRDNDQDGICEYYHGNDSGWDNSTAFRIAPTVEMPELSAFLIVQMDTLSEIALKIGNHDEAKSWKSRADKTLQDMISHCFNGVKPKALISRTHEVVENNSLIMYIAIVLGERLPKEIRDYFIEVLKSDKFFTPYGFATESPASELYESDGYWRGPIWSPSTLLLIDGIQKCGEAEFAKEAARRFCNMVRDNGFAENFNALTGEALRDHAYTWTASVFMILAHEYL